MYALQLLLEATMDKLSPLAKEGELASYIPALAQANQEDFGACIYCTDGSVAKYGDFKKRFTIQSISKVLSFLSCLLDSPREQVFEKISVEPSPSPFNAIADLELHAAGKPLNPMINAGAIAVMEFVAGNTAIEKFARIQNLARHLTGNANINCNEDVYTSEQITGDRNRSLAYYMKSIGIIAGKVDDLLEVYFRVCALEMTCEDLAKIALTLARGGVDDTGKILLPKEIVQTTCAVMATCGMYNESGLYAVEVGVPSKSGVGGGILAVVPNKMGIGIYSPALNEHGTSVCGRALMKALSEELSLHIF